MKFRFIGLVTSLILMTLTCITAVHAATGLPVARIGIVMDGPWARYPQGFNLLKKEILSLTEDQFDVRFPADFTLVGDWTIAGVNQAIDRLMSRDDVDLIIAMGYVASNEISKRHRLAKPVIAPFVIDAALQGLPLKDGTSGVKNLAYINSFKSLRRDIKAFKEVASFSSLTILGDSVVLEAIPQLHEGARQIAGECALYVNIVGIESSMEDALENLPPFTEAVMVGPLFRLTPDEFQKLAAGLTERRLPSFSLWGRDDVELGILATTTPPGTMEHLARSVAINVQDILSGEDAGTLSVAFAIGEQLTINMATARAVDIYPSLSILTEADLLNEERKDIQRVLTLEKSVQEALAANLDLAAADRSVAAGAQQVLEARSQLLPQVDVGTQAVAIDDDRAEVSGGTNPERAWTGSATGTQVLYSEKAWSSYTVQKHFQDARVEGREGLKLNIIEAAATAYLDVLRAKTVEWIQKDNLKLTRANLQRARARESIGIAGPDEVYRWESEIANSRRAVLESESRTMNVMNRLNRILNRPIQEAFIAKEAELTDPMLVESDKLFFHLVSKPESFQVFRAFMVNEGLEIAPELRQLDAEIAARKRELVSAKRAYWLPTFSLQGSVTEFFDDDGEGTRDTSPIQNDTDWSVGVYATFPLFSGGQKTATHRRTVEDLAGLRIERRAMVERIEQRILDAINLTRASYPSIQLTQDGADAAQKNLKLITDYYARGIKSIIDLLDAQNLALVSDQRAANAVYDFLIDLMRIQRAVGKFDLFLSAEDRQAWIHKMEDYFKKEGVDPGTR